MSIHSSKKKKKSNVNPEVDLKKDSKTLSEKGNCEIFFFGKVIETLLNLICD